jgi:hypothetical protein
VKVKTHVTAGKLGANHNTTVRLQCLDARRAAARRGGPESPHYNDAGLKARTTTTRA